MKPRIRINADGHPTIVRIPLQWLKGNQFRETILVCWLRFIKDNQSK